jgi:hypothetical protein
MKYSCNYILGVAGNCKKIPLIPPPTVYQSLIDVLDAGLILKKDPSGAGLLVTSKQGVVHDWANLPSEMVELMSIPILIIQRSDDPARKIKCSCENSRSRLLELGFPDPEIDLKLSDYNLFGGVFLKNRNVNL